MATYDGTFNRAVALTLEDEGVLSDRPDDRGGITKYGITAPFYSDYLGRPATAADIIALTKEKAIDVYHTLLWQRRKIGTLPTPLALKVFDFAVHSGAETAIHSLQKMVGVVRDGNIGPVTMAAVAAAFNRRANGVRAFCNDYVINRGRFLMDVTQRDPDHALSSVEGWFNRVIRQLDFGY